jgi:hypothetical protein
MQTLIGHLMTNNKIFISGPHGVGCSMIKSMAVGVRQIDPVRNTCHQSWTRWQTTQGDDIRFGNDFDCAVVFDGYKPDIRLWVSVSDHNIDQLCERIVLLDFLYADDAEWISNDWSWSQDKHNRLAGPDWPKYSTRLEQYPLWCRLEMLKVAQDRIKPWQVVDARFNWNIPSAELYDDVDPTELKKFLAHIGCVYDEEFLHTWRRKNKKMYLDNTHLFRND